MTEIVAAHLERVARELAQQLEDRAIQRAHPPEGEVSVGDEPWECVLCSAESATNEVKHNVTCPILGVAAALAACAREAEEPLRERIEQLEAILNTPELDDFAKGVALEAKHQRARWGDSHDLDKEPEEWFWVVGYLAGKGLQAQRAGNWDKFKHHLITGAAIFANWHARALERAVGEKAPLDPQGGHHDS